ncbi:MAG: glutamate synthase [Eggerthellaceae bacterium]|jgi:glutamate synthase domain-containing protein 3|nr:glutamate synthase [Eggerthellaceae bacterium]MCH4221108.1 glutamate synthase [Eggerthellaceae bacterium]
MTHDDTVSVSLGTEPFKEANERVRAALDEHNTVTLRDVCAQRYLGCAMPKGKHLLVHGTPGNDMACYMDGGSIEVFGNAQDQVGNTMNDGQVVIHGRSGDATGYAMRGGQIFIRNGCGWRVGIHMKQYQTKCPAIVIGGDAGNFLGEYLAGGVIILLGHAGEYLATGMHGGVIYLKNRIEDDLVLAGLVQEPVDDTDCKIIGNLLGRYNGYFGDELEAPVDTSGKGFWRLRPASSRPYATMYAG